MQTVGSGGGSGVAQTAPAKKPITPLGSKPTWHAPMVAPAAARPAVAAPSAPTLTSPQVPNQYTASGYSGGTYSTDGVGGDTTVPVTKETAVDPDAYKADPTYIESIANLKKILGGYQADHDRNLTTYDTDYNTGLTNLGWNADSKTWNQDDTNTAYGRSYDNQLNDFGSRDMLNSSYYGEALNNMLRQYNDQKTGIDTARTNYRDDQDAALQTNTQANQTAMNQAKAEAIARLAAGVSIGG